MNWINLMIGLVQLIKLFVFNILIDFYQNSKIIIFNFIRISLYLILQLLYIIKIQIINNK